MEDDLITTKEVGDYRIKVYYCRDSECPITNWGLFGSFIKYGICRYAYRICIDSYPGYVVKDPITLTEWVQGLKPGTIIKIRGIFIYHFL